MCVQHSYIPVDALFMVLTDTLIEYLWFTCLPHIKQNLEAYIVEEIRPLVLKLKLAHS